MRIPLLIAPVVAGLLLLKAPNNTEAPDPESVRKLYGEPTMERFAALSGITVTVQYGPDRLACQILIAPRRLLVEVQSPDSMMSSPGVSHVLEELLPPTTRGRQVDSKFR